MALLGKDPIRDSEVRPVSDTSDVLALATLISLSLGCSHFTEKIMMSIIHELSGSLSRSQHDK